MYNLFLDKSHSAISFS